MLINKSKGDSLDNHLIRLKMYKLESHSKSHLNYFIKLVTFVLQPTSIFFLFSLMFLLGKNSVPTFLNNTLPARCHHVLQKEKTVHIAS
jgi:hypothetical protein